MKNKVFKFKLHNKEIMMKISENGMFPLNVMIDQNQLINLLGMNFKDFLKSNEIIYFLENYKSQSPLFIVSEMDLENSKIKWINVLFVEMFDKEYNYRGLKEWLYLKRQKNLKYFFMKEYRKHINKNRKKIKVEDDFIKNGNFSELHLLKKELKIQGRIAGEDTSTD